MSFEEKVAYFKAKQKEIVELDLKCKSLQAKFQNDLEKEIKEPRAALQKKVEEYRAELKAWCGLTDGEPTDVLTMLTAIRGAARD